MVNRDCSGSDDQLDFAAGIASAVGFDRDCDVAAAGSVRVCHQAFAAFTSGCAAVSRADGPVCDERFSVWRATGSAEVDWDLVGLGGRGVLFARGSASNVG